MDKPCLKRCHLFSYMQTCVHTSYFKHFLPIFNVSLSHWIGHLISYSRFYELLRHWVCFANSPAAHWWQKPFSEGTASYHPSILQLPCGSQQSLSAQPQWIEAQCRERWLMHWAPTGAGRAVGPPHTEPLGYPSEVDPHSDFKRSQHFTCYFIKY